MGILNGEALPLVLVLAPFKRRAHLRVRSHYVAHLVKILSSPTSVRFSIFARPLLDGCSGVAHVFDIREILHGSAYKSAFEVRTLVTVV